MGKAVFGLDFLVDLGYMVKTQSYTHLYLENDMDIQNTIK
jgi:hypothetical protein